MGSSPLRNPSVQGGKPLRIQVRGEYQEVPWPGDPGATLGILSADFFVDGGGGQGLPPLRSEFQDFLRVSAPPDRCFRRVPPKPPGQQQSLPPPPVTKWVPPPQLLDQTDPLVARAWDRSAIPNFLCWRHPMKIRLFRTKTVFLLNEIGEDSVFSTYHWTRLKSIRLRSRLAASTRTRTRSPSRKA